jgi:hypothetical protein
MSSSSLSLSRPFNSSYKLLLASLLCGSCSLRASQGAPLGTILVAVYHNTGGPAPLLTGRILWENGFIAWEDEENHRRYAKVSPDVIARFRAAMSAEGFEKSFAEVAAARLEDRLFDREMLSIERGSERCSMPPEEVPAELVPFLRLVDEVWRDNFGKRYRTTVAPVDSIKSLVLHGDPLLPTARKVPIDINLNCGVTRESKVRLAPGSNQTGYPSKAGKRSLLQSGTTAAGDGTLAGNVLIGAGGRPPSIREELEDAFLGPAVGELAENVGEVRQGRDVVKCAGPAEAVEVRGAASGVVRSAEEKIPSA